MSNSFQISCLLLLSIPVIANTTLLHMRDSNPVVDFVSRYDALEILGGDGCFDDGTTYCPPALGCVAGGHCYWDNSVQYCVIGQATENKTTLYAQTKSASFPNGKISKKELDEIYCWQVTSCKRFCEEGSCRRDWVINGSESNPQTPTIPDGASCSLN